MTNVTLGEARQARQALEATILQATMAALAEFRERTGLSPEAIDIRMARVDRLSDLHPEYIPVEVNARVDLV